MPLHETFPKHLGVLVYNSNSERYEITENGIVYHLTAQHASLITGDFRSIADWYNNLSRFTRLQIWLMKAGKD
jgi:hypothetical protein